MRIILASASPRRRELLEQIGLPFEVITSHVEEKISSARPGEAVEELSRQKAEAVGDLVCRSLEEADKPPCLKETGGGWDPAGQKAAGAGRGVLVIGTDTIVSLDGAILGKPLDGKDAARMLGRLQGREHEVYTGVTLLYLAAGSAEWERKSFHERTKVWFFPMSEGEIAEYVSTGDPLDKAGAYGIQGFCARYIRGLEGDYNNVVGLPAGRLYQEIKELLKR